MPARKFPKWRNATLSATALTPDRILAAAVAVMDEEGMAMFTMRKLGERLSVQAMSLYRYFPSKDALIEAVSDALFSQIREPNSLVDPIGSMRDVMISFYELAEAHPSMIELLFVGPRIKVFSELVERDLATLNSAGLGNNALAALQTLVSFTVGAVRVRAHSTPSERRQAFEFGLDIVLNGLRFEIQRSGALPK